MEEQPPSPQTQGLAKVMIIAAWVLALMLLMLFFDHWNKKNNMNTEAKMITVDGVQQTILKRNAQNQYMAQGFINGSPVVFLLDTGATDVVIPGNLAKKLKLSHGLQGMASTAGGNVTIYQTRIRELVIGSITLHNLVASISPQTQSNEVLLGMSALKKITFYQEGDNLILTIKNRQKAKE